MFHNCTKLPNWDGSVTDKTKAYKGAGGYMKEKPIDATQEADGSWSFAMPAADVLLEVEYSTPASPPQPSVIRLRTLLK